MSPYIKQERRPEFERLVDLLTLELTHSMEPGDLNYVIFAAVKRHLQDTGKGYEKIRNILAELHECQHEIRRRFLFEHENSKILENGDVE